MFYGTLFPLAFHAKPVLATSTISYSLVARIRLLWILEVLIQLRIRRHRRRFQPHWIFPRSVESWFEIYLQLSSAIFLRFCSVEICEWLEIHSAIY